MRIRKPFAAAFVLLCIVASFLGLTPFSLPWHEYHSDKFLHFFVFFVLTTVFYWIIDTNRRRVIHITLVVCAVVLGIGSEILQLLVPNGRIFDPYDIAANIVGSLVGAGLCTWYHRRMLERKRIAKGYRAVSGDADVGQGGGDVELGEGTGPQETGVTGATSNITEELDNWDEHAEDDWDEEDTSAPPAFTSAGSGGKPAVAAASAGDAKKRDD